ncbi:hypothetical protein C8Q74DRAFT_1317829 [Fomes fomentarius]|nr:hypothetical protein C8Q74DRAFT_1317829 [Fomes fomentarius]
MDSESDNLWASSSSEQSHENLCYRGSRGGSTSYHRDYTEVSLPPDRNIPDGLQSTAIRTISKPTVSASSGGPVKPENVKFLGSYNWVEEPNPTMIVPGSPPVWRDRPFPYRVFFDSGVRFVDQNGYRMGNQSCLLPIFRAVDVIYEEDADTSMDWSAVDFVTDRNGLRKLMRWIQHSPDNPEEQLKEFRIDLQLGGKKTVLMHRWEKRTRELSDRPRSGCGMNFEHASTTPAKGCKRGTGHHRIIQYDLDGLRMVVRFEVDACLPPAENGACESSESSESSVGAKSASADSLGNTVPTEIESLTDIMSNLNVTSENETSPAQSNDITVIRAGSQIPQSSIVELVTRSVKYIDEFDWQEQYPQLLLSWTPHLFLAVHDRGTFERMVKHELGTTELRHIEASTRVQSSFQKLVETLKTIQALVMEHGRRRRLSLVCQPDGTLNVFECTSEQGCLPDSELERFGGV